MRSVSRAPALSSAPVALSGGVSLAAVWGGMGVFLPGVRGCEGARVLGRPGAVQAGRARDACGWLAQHAYWPSRTRTFLPPPTPTPPPPCLGVLASWHPGIPASRRPGAQALAAGCWLRAGLRLGIRRERQSALKHGHRAARDRKITDSFRRAQLAGTLRLRLLSRRLRFRTHERSARAFSGWALCELCFGRNKVPCARASCIVHRPSFGKSRLRTPGSPVPA